MDIIPEVDCDAHCLEGHLVKPPVGLIIFLFLLVVSLTLLILAFRLLIWVRRLKKAGFEVFRTRGGFRYKKDTEEHFVTRCMLFLILVGCQVYGCVEPERILDNGAGVVSATMMESESICFTQGHVSLDMMRMQHPVKLLYATGEWTHEPTFEWFCSIGSCPSISDCNKEDGVRLGSGSFLIQKSCRSYIRGCTFGSGCWRGQSKVKVVAKSKVYRVLEGYNRIKLSEHRLKCSHEVQKTQASPIKDTLILEENGAYLCDGSSPRGEPTVGRIGDIQSDGDKLLFSWGSISCIKDWFWDGKCIETRPKRDNCVQLPAVIDGITHSYSDGYVWTQRQVPSVIQFKCNETSLEPYHLRTTKPTLKIIGKRGSSAGIRLLAYCHSLEGEGTIWLSLQCDALKQFMLQCDGHKHYYPISDLLECNITDLSTNDTLEYNDETSSRWATHSDWLDELSWSYMGHISWFTLTAIVVLALLLLRH